ncbi:hypothetical protein B0H10DRAFT_1938504 [Mycena sp. CBHHK59/15]|nr:hypothetical protein B0H10DRAFT_1938504 [Mycena sp. CBHHK59/15]
MRLRRSPTLKGPHPHLLSEGPSACIHTAHQIRFANSVRNMHYTPELLKAVLDSSTLRAYTAPDLRYFRWLDDPGARRTLRDSLAGYATSSSESPLLAKLNLIMQELDGTNEEMELDAEP